MKKIFFLVNFILLTIPLCSQVIVGNSTQIKDGVILQVDSETQGVLFPVIQLTNRNNQSPLTGVVPTGTFIFNTNSFGSFPYEVTPGFFWWDNENNQWNPMASSIENFTAKYANLDFGQPVTEGAINDYYDSTPKKMKLFGTTLFNENFEALERIDDTSIKFNYSGLYAISVILSLNKYSDDPAIALKVNLKLDNNPVGITHYVRSSSAVSTTTGVYFANSFTEYIQVNEGHTLSIESVRATLQDPATYRVNFNTQGSSSITISRIR